LTNKLKPVTHDEEVVLSSTLEDDLNDIANQLYATATTAFCNETVEETAIDQLKVILEKILTYSSQQVKYIAICILILMLHLLLDDISSYS
jgi:hypothetical protein